MDTPADPLPNKPHPLQDQPRPVPPARGGRPPWVGAVLFHLGGVVASGVAGVAAAGALLVVSFGTSTCGPATDPGLVADLRLGTGAIGTGLAAVPAVWALVGHRTGRAWWPWAALAGVVLLVTLAAVASTHEVSTWCF